MRQHADPRVQTRRDVVQGSIWRRRPKLSFQSLDALLHYFNRLKSLSPTSAVRTLVEVIATARFSFKPSGCESFTPNQNFRQTPQYPSSSKMVLDVLEQNLDDRELRRVAGTHQDRDPEASRSSIVRFGQ